MKIQDSDIIILSYKLRMRSILHDNHRALKSPVLVFLHEGLGCIDSWADFPETLASMTGYDALVYDRLGHGKSSPLAYPRTYQYLHEEALIDLPQIMTHFQLDQVILIGHSDGGSIALLFAAAYPDRVKGIITEAAHVFVADVTTKGIKDTVNAYEKTDLKERLTRYHARNTETLFRAWADTWLSPQFKKWNIEYCLPRIKSPILIIQGRDDEYGTAKQVEAIASQVAVPAKAYLVSKCGHIPHLQARKRVLEEMTSFIKS
jgi:pimeloyl-ACP methyl ester carboxylesterase